MAQIEIKIFTALPKITILSKKEGINWFEKNIDKIYDPNTKPQFNTIASMILVRLTTENPDYCWQLEDYGIFRTIFASVAIKEIDVLGPSIQICLEASSKENYEKLQLFSQQCDWYLSKINEIKEITPDKQVTIRGIHPTDCFYVLTNLLSYMNRDIRQYAENIFENFTREDFYNAISKLRENDINKYLKLFEEKYQFLTEYHFFSDLFFKMKENLLKKIVTYLKECYEQEKVRQAYRTKVENKPLYSFRHRNSNSFYKKMWTRKPNTPKN